MDSAVEIECLTIKYWSFREPFLFYDLWFLFLNTKMYLYNQEFALAVLCEQCLSQKACPCVNHEASIPTYMYCIHRDVTLRISSCREHIVIVSLHNAPGALCYTLENEEMVIFTRWFLEFKLDQGSVIP